MKPNLETRLKAIEQAMGDTPEQFRRLIALAVELGKQPASDLGYEAWIARESGAMLATLAKEFPCGVHPKARAQAELLVQLYKDLQP